jgi:hypothetical protein
MREEVSDLKAIESAASADFDLLAQSFISGSGNTYVINGFAINMASNPIGGAASNLQVIVQNGALLATTASQSGTFFLVPAGTPNAVLNAATTSNVYGSFVPSSYNYVGVDYYRFQDPTTDTQRYIWDPTAQDETQIIAPAAIVLNYEFVITSSIWAENILPIAIIQTDSSNNVVSITDARPLLFRLGTGGASPNPFYVYPWPGGLTETASPTTTSNSSNPFLGGDKDITDLKDWIDAIETLLLEIGGGPYWYSFNSAGPSASIPQLREDAINTILTGNGNIIHSATTPGLINWTSPINITIVGSNLNYQITTNPTGTTVTLSDGEVAYLELNRDVTIGGSNLIWTNGSNVVSSVGNITWTTNLYSNTANGSGDWVKLTSATHAGYYQIQSIINSYTVTLSTNFTGTSTGATGASSQYSYGEYTLPGVTGSTRDIQLAQRGSVPINPNTFWLFARDDNGGAIPRVYVRWLGLDLQQGDSEEISGPQLQNVLTYIGSPIESAVYPEYVSAYSLYLGGGGVVYKQITSITTGDASTMASGEYFLINSSNDARMYAVWVKKDGSGSQPVVAYVNAYLEWDVTTGQTAAQTAATLVTALNGISPFSDFTATAISNVVTVYNDSSGVSTNGSNISVGAPFSLTTTQEGTGIGNNFINDGDDLTLAIKKLDLEVGNLVASLDSPTYDEVVEIVASGATPPSSLNGPVANGTVITMPLNSREGNIVSYYTVGKGTLQVFLNGQFLDLESGAYEEIGPTGAPSNQIEILTLSGGGLVVGDELEFRIGVGGGGGGGTVGPPGPAGPSGPQGPPGFNAAGGPVPVSTKSGNYVILTTDCFVAGDCTSAPLTFTLPPASGNTGRIFYVKKIDSTSNALVVVGSGSDTIDGSSSQSILGQWISLSLISNGTSYWRF